MFLPASSFFGKKRKGFKRLSSTCETTRVTPREYLLLGRSGWPLHRSDKSQVTFSWTFTYNKGGRIKELREGAQEQEEEDLRTGESSCDADVHRGGKWIVMPVFEKADPKN